MSYMAQRVRGFGATIFAEMTSLANQHNAINLGQGFPDFPGPAFLKQAAIKAIQNDVNQYAPMRGQPTLRETIAKKVADTYGISFDPETEIVVTHGATEALFATILGVVDPGDEVVVFEPYYDSYVPAIQIAQGVPRFYTLRPPDWSIDPAQLAALFSDKTKAVMINTPHNPTGKVFSRAELQLIADLCRQFDALAITDEVYEHIIFDDCKHLLLASLPGMADRTITISSSGKSYSVTGWKVGWAMAKPDLIRAIVQSHQFMVFSGAAPLQEGVAVALQAPHDYYDELGEMYQRNRDLLAEALNLADLNPIMPQGTYFMMADISHLKNFADDVAFCKHLTTQIGVAAIPPSAFSTTRQMEPRWPDSPFVNPAKRWKRPLAGWQR
ncbi:MAG: aminotransferase class I/II-fold pyridoxal phosphate-dependent enzyme [Anaerolineae bacterium]|nr:aminotransferase class I/II-fold pyridoxal phosphate-dependent enzyme [Anaerolineae bacterium]